jgi:uncharacterized protein GlcG (DUF336 family)
MTNFALADAKKIIAAALIRARELGLKPLTIAVLDAGGSLKTLEREDGASLMRPEIAYGKAYGAIAMGLGSRALFERAQQQSTFINAMNVLARGALVPVPGGVLIRNEGGTIVGAVGITGDTSDNDEACAVAGISAAGFMPDTGG